MYRIGVGLGFHASMAIGALEPPQGCAFEIARFSAPLFMCVSVRGRRVSRFNLNPAADPDFVAMHQQQKPIQSNPYGFVPIQKSAQPNLPNSYR
jgi:hypothetical protein